MKYTPVKGNSSLVRDRDTGAILNINSNEVDRARLRKLNREKEQKEFDALKDEVREMKSMLNQILGKLNG